MKKIHGINKRFFFTFTIAIILFIILNSCNDIFLPDDNLKNLPEGKGSFSLMLTDASRTILPATPVLSDFVVYNLIFTSTTGSTVVNTDRTNENITIDPIILDSGTYNLIVNAYIDEEKNQLTARGTLDNLNISAGANTKDIVILKAVLSGGIGTFHWNISIPSDIESANMIISPRNADGTIYEPIILTAPKATGSCPLNSGSYNITINLEKVDKKTVAWKELLYIYRNLDSVFNYTFTEAHFNDSRYTVTYKYNDGGFTEDWTQYILHGGTVTRPDNPIRNGYIFSGWYTDNNIFENTYSFNQPVTGSFTLYAKWNLVPVTGVVLFPPTMTLSMGEMRGLSAVVEPANATNKNVTWMSDNPLVAKVDEDGTVTAVDIGKTQIYVRTNDGNKITSCVITVIESYNYDTLRKYITDEYSLDDKIKYSVSYGGYNFYYIYLGKMRNIPLFSYETYFHDGQEHTYTITITDTIKESVQNTISDSRQTTLGVVENYTTSKTTGGKSTTEINNKFTINKKFGLPAVSTVNISWEGGLKEAVDVHWSEVNTNSTSNSTQLTTSLTNTETKGTDYTKSKMETRTWPFNNRRIGYYRYSLFSVSDVYLYVIIDPKNLNELYYEFREHLIPEQSNYSWMLEYSEYDPTFALKSDESRFGFDVSMLDSLYLLNPEDITPYDNVTFNSNGGSAVPGQFVYLSTVTRPDDPTRNGYTFVNWYINSELTAVYDFSSQVTGDITLYAKWQETWGNTLASKLSWLQSYAETGGNYILEVTANESINASTLSYSGKSNINITIKSINTRRVISNSTSNSIMFTVGNGVILKLENITLRGQSGILAINASSVIRISSGGELIMENNSLITGNSALLYNGGGVFVNNNGIFTMNGGVISENKALVGGGVYVNTNGIFTMKDGEISGNSANSGGGVYVKNNGKFKMEKGIISGNKGTTYGGGVSVYGAFIMDNGNISGNTCSTDDGNPYGGGVHIGSEGIFTMKNGNILGNDVISYATGNYGGGVCVDGTFIMNGGKISYNNAININTNLFSSSGRSYGGGVYVNTNGQFIMNNYGTEDKGGEISSNTAKNNIYGAESRGGGVAVVGGTFRIIYGTIYGSETNNGVDKNNAGSGSAVYGNTSFGVYDGSTWVEKRTQGTTNSTLVVKNGVKQ